MQTLLKADHVAFYYTEQPLFSGLHFSLHTGDLAALTGGNGTGKSTLMRLLLGEMPATHGSIELLGQPIEAFCDWSKIGYVSQAGRSRGQSFPATAREIVQANLYTSVGRFRFARPRHRQKALQALAQVGLEAQSEALFDTLSGGQQQRVMLARALVNDPLLLLLDEPTTGLDPVTVKELFKLLERLHRENQLTVLMITHDLMHSARYMNRIFCLEQGSLVELALDQFQAELAHRHVHPAAPSCAHCQHFKEACDGNFSV